MGSTYEGIYYPACSVDDWQSFLTYGLVFDRLHLVHFGIPGRDPTTHFQVAGRGIAVHVHGAEQQPFTSQVLAAYRFAQRINPAIGSFVFYHPNLAAVDINQLVDNLLSGATVPYDEFFRVVDGTGGLIGQQKGFLTEHPELGTDVAFFTVPAAIHYAGQNGWHLIGADSTMPVPMYHRHLASVRALTVVLAEECVRLMLPSCHDVPIDALLATRQQLSDSLIPFRLSLQRLSGTLRQAIAASASLADIHAEARFVVESQIEPAVYVLRRTIADKKSKEVRWLFGRVLRWVPFVAKAFAAPSPGSIYEVIRNTVADASDLTERIHERHLERDPGLSFLLALHDKAQEWNGQDGWM